MKTLHIFVDSERPDQYLNTIVHCVLDRDVRAIEFLHIRTLTSIDTQNRSNGLSSRVMAAVQSQLKNLAERHEYTSQSADGSHQRVELASIYGQEKAAEVAAYYERVREISLSYSNREVEYDELRSVMQKLAEKGSNAFLDVTAVKKRYLGDIIAAGLVEGIRGLWTFDLLIRTANFDKPWSMLIHELRASGTVMYRYTNILDTQTYKACVRLVFIRAPRYKRMAIGTVALILVSALGYFVLGEESQAVKVILAMSGIASIASLALVFSPPRSEA